MFPKINLSQLEDVEFIPQHRKHFFAIWGLGGRAYWYAFTNWFWWTLSSSTFSSLSFSTPACSWRLAANIFLPGTASLPFYNFLRMKRFLSLISSQKAVGMSLRRQAMGNVIRPRLFAFCCPGDLRYHPLYARFTGSNRAAPPCTRLALPLVVSLSVELHFTLPSAFASFLNLWCVRPSTLMPDPKESARVGLHCNP